MYVLLDIARGILVLASDALVNSTEWWRISYRIIYDSYRSVFRKETVENHIIIKYGMFSRRLYEKISTKNIWMARHD